MIQACCEFKAPRKGLEDPQMTRCRHTPEQIVPKLAVDISPASLSLRRLPEDRTRLIEEE